MPIPSKQCLLVFAGATLVAGSIAQETTSTASSGAQTTHAAVQTTSVTPLTTPAAPAPPPSETPVPDTPGNDNTTATPVVNVNDTPTSVTTPDGIIYQVLKEGNGPQADTTSTRLIHYTLYLANGTKLESSREKILPTPFEFSPGLQQAIRGMELGTDGMRVGESRRIFIPARLGYGSKAHGSVPPDSDLLFEVELVALKESESNSSTDASPLISE